MRLVVSVFARTLFGFLVLLFTGLPVFGQAAGGIIGAVVDESGAVIPGADVRAHQTATGTEHTDVTDANGAFQFPQLPLGTYDITATNEGFETTVRRGVEVVTGRTVDLRMAMNVGAVSQQVEVVGLTPAVQTSSAEVQATIDSRAIRELPLNGRDPLQLVVLTPGAAFTGTSSFGTPETGGFGPNEGVTVNGLHSTDNNYRIDGGDFNDTATNQAPELPSPDALREFTIKSSNFSAQHPRAGALVQLSTRSGGNQFHGSIFEFFRNDDLDARPAFATEKQAFVRNQFGGTFGGPIVKNKTFFFGSVQVTRRRGSPNIKRLTVPNARERNGDFGGQAPVVDPSTGEPFPGNQIPESRFSSITPSLVGLYPLPEGDANTVFLPRQVDKDDDQILVKVDHHFATNHQIDVRWFYSEVDAQRDTTSPSGILGMPSFNNHLIGVNDTYTVNPNLLVTTSFSWSNTETVLAPETPLTLQELGAQIPKATDRTPREIRFNPSGFSRLFSGGLLNFDPQTFEAKSHASWTLGKHTLQFGFDFQRQIHDSFDESNGSGQFFFNGTRTQSQAIAGSGLTIADVLLGLPNRFTQRGGAPQEFRENKYHPWINDTWKIHPRVTLNLGLRYEPWIPFTDKLSPLGGLVPGAQSFELPDAPPSLVFAGAGLSDLPGRDRLFADDLNNFAPRFGLAWDVFGDGKTVFRGGYGIFYRNPPFNILRDQSQRLPFTARQVDIFDPPSVVNPFADDPEGTPFPFSPVPPEQLKDFEFPRPVNIGILDPFATTSYVQNWNVTVERELAQGLGLSIGYVGNHGVKQLLVTEGNPAVFGPGATNGNTNDRRLFPGVGSARFITPAFGNSNFQSLQVGVTRRSPSGLNLIANYVYGRAIDVSSSGSLGGGGFPRNPFNEQLDRGRADFDVTHRANISVNYPVPAITSLRGVADKVLNHWQLNSIVTLQSGSPFTVKAGRNRSLTGVGNDNADLIGDPELDNPTTERYFNTAAFALPAEGSVGTVGRNTLAGPKQITVDFSVFKDVPITERLNYQFRFEAFNLFNRTNLSNPVSNLNNGNFGRILDAGDPRVLQFAMKLTF